MVCEQVRQKPGFKEKRVRSFKFWILEKEGLLYLCSKNKGADKMCSYCTADLRLLFFMHIVVFMMLLCSYDFLNHKIWEMFVKLDLLHVC